MDIYTACEQNDVEALLRALSENGVGDINKLYERGTSKSTLLHHAAGHGHFRIVQALLGYGADANIRNNLQRLPIHDACIGGYDDILDLLLHHTEDMNGKNNHGQTAFHVACYHGELSCLNVLLHNKCKVEAVDSSARSGLDLAVMKDHKGCLRALLIHQPMLIHRSNPDGRTAFHFAAQHGAMRCIHFFVQNYCQHSTVTDNNGLMPVHYAAKYGKMAVLKYLLENCSNVSDSDYSCRNVAHCAAVSPSLECLHYAIEMKSNLTLQDKFGNTVLHYASMNKQATEMVNCLKNHGAELEIENKSGDTPNYCARKAGNTIAFQKAITDITQCKFCIKKKDQMVYDEAHKPSDVEEKISVHQSELYDSQIPSSRSSLKKIEESSSLTGRSTTKRNMAAKFYGGHIA